MIRSLTLILLIASTARSAELRDDAAAGLKKAVGYFRTNVGVQGGYLWKYSEDLTKREGENRATATQAWVQPPGTPAVGLALLNAYESTGDPYYREAAIETAHALVRGQLRSGGWDYKIEFDPKLRGAYAYRTEATPGKFNVTTFDDNVSQAVLRFLMRVDTLLERKDQAVHEAVIYALDSLLKAQYPNGAWPQRYEAFPEAGQFPVAKASYPESWSREFPKAKYYTHYTFNDNSLADVIDVMLEAERTYGGGKYRAAAEKGGGFMLLAQMPDPQPGWAQQYDAEMHPAWARKFEPPSITGGEAQGIMRTLLRLYRETGDAKYVETLPKAIAYYRKSLLPNGQLARFYELKTNKPLYFTKEYVLTYDDSDLPTHYGFKVSGNLDAIEKELEALKKTPPPPGGVKPAAKGTGRKKPSPSQEAEVKKVLAALDDKGRWLEEGKMKTFDDAAGKVIDVRTFIKNANVLSAYLAATRP